MQNDQWLARIHLPDSDGAMLILRPDYTWEVTDEEEYSGERTLALAATVGYRYSPAHGRRGVLLAEKVAKKFPGAVVEYPPESPERPGVVY